MKKIIVRLWDGRPLRLILGLALFFRLLAAVFSKGYGMHDDHFLVIESSQSWVDGYDYNNWLPSSHGDKLSPSGHSFTYSGLHYVFFKALQSVGLTDPQLKMFFVRLLHALLSLTVVYFAYRIAEKLSGMRTARMAALLLALYFFMPVLSVRNLVEVACIPFLMYPTWLVIKREEKMRVLEWFAAGLLLGFAFNIRFQCILFAGGFGLALLFRKKWWPAVLTGLGFLVCAAALQGITDYFIWGKPFVEFKEYVRYNLENATDYFSREWYMYFTVLAGILIPPISIFLLFGFFRSWKKYLILFLPSFVFLAFHSYFPNKQERFILPIIPFVITLGMIGWNEFTEHSSFWQHRQKLLRACWIFFWALNIPPLLVLSVSYSKRSRVEAMVYLAGKGDAQGFVVEAGDRDGSPLMPRFYMNKWVLQHDVNRADSLEKFMRLVNNHELVHVPNYVIFFSGDDLDKRAQRLKNYFPALRYEATIEPSFIDWLLHWLNPQNENETCYVYKLRD